MSTSYQTKVTIPIFIRSLIASDGQHGRFYDLQAVINTKTRSIYYEIHDQDDRLLLHTNSQTAAEDEYNRLIK